MNALFFVSFAVAVLALVGFAFLVNWLYEKGAGLVRSIKTQDEWDALIRWQRRVYGEEIQPAGPCSRITPSGTYRVTRREKPPEEAQRDARVYSIKRQGARR